MKPEVIRKIKESAYFTGSPDKVLRTIEVATDVKSTESFITAALIMAYSYLETLDKEQMALLKEAGAKSKKFLNAYSLNKKLFSKAVRAISSGKGYDSVAEDLFEFATEVRRTGKKIKSDLDLSRVHIALINSWQNYIRTDSERAWSRMVKFSSSLGNPIVSKMFHSEGGDVNKQKQSVEDIVKKLTKRKDDDLSPEERKNLKEKNPKLYKQFLKERRELVNLSKDKIMQLVRLSGQPYLPIENVKKALTDGGYLDILPDNYKGYVDDLGALYTVAGKRINGVPHGKVKMNPKYNPDEDNAYVMTAIPPGSVQPQRYYTVDYRKSKNVKKAENVNKLIGSIENLKKKWRTALKSGKGEKAVLALMLELTYLTQARIGTMGNVTSGESTYGLSTWKRKHITFKGNTVIIKYRGKKGVLQKHIVKSDNPITRMVVNNLKDLWEETDSPEDYVFVHGGDRINGTKVNKYLRSIGAKVTIHKFRTLRGTILAEKVLQKGLKKFNTKGEYTEREVNKWVKSALEVVGQELGHYSGDKVTAATAIRSYILPNVFADFYSKVGVRPPSTIEKVIDSL